MVELSGCPKCGKALAPGALFCAHCTAVVPGQELKASAVLLLTQVEEGVPYVVGQAPTVRLRLTYGLDAPCEVTVRATPYGRGRFLDVDDEAWRQTCRFERKGDQRTYRLPFQPKIAGDFPIDQLRIVVSRPDAPGKVFVSELPDRGLSLAVTDPNSDKDSGITIGDIHLDLSKTEAYGADIRDLITIASHDQEKSEAPGTEWVALGVTPVGEFAEDAGRRCRLPGCGRFLFESETFECPDCHRRVCLQHRHDEFRDLCAPCGEAARQERFGGGAGTTPDDPFRPLADLHHPDPPFLARLWTDPRAEPTSRTILTVPRENRASHRIGQKFAFKAEAERPCYLTLVNFGTSGQAALLLHDHELPSGRPVALDGPDARHEWIIGGPPGVERLKAVFSLQPLRLFPAAGEFSLLGAGAEAERTLRDAATKLNQLPPETWADASCEFTVA